MATVLPPSSTGNLTCCVCWLCVADARSPPPWDEPRLGKNTLPAHTDLKESSSATMPYSLLCKDRRAAEVLFVPHWGTL